LPLLVFAAACSSSSGPSRTAPSAPVRELSSSGDLTCAVTADSTAWCWGHAFGPRPARWAPNYKFRYVSVAATPAGNYLCGVTGGHQVVCQGTVVVDSSGAWDLGSMPTLLAADTAVDTVTTGASHLCGVNAGHHAWCWGEYGAGDRGDSIVPAGRDSFATPSLVAGGHLWSGIAAGNSHSCAMATDRTVFCWGAGAEVGIPDSASYDTAAAHCGTSLHGGAPCSYVPLHLTTVPEASGVVSAASTTCALTTVNTVWCWGYVGPTAGHVSQVPVAMPLSVSAIAVALGSAGGYCVISTAGDAYCGNLGTAPSLVPGGLRFLNISTGSDHACAIGVGGYLYCWGSNGEGQLGVGDSTSRGTPIQVVIPDSTS
jgi:alpha-tubulin suppressor-like RCC1 family protein